MFTGVFTVFTPNELLVKLSPQFWVGENKNLWEKAYIGQVGERPETLFVCPLFLLGCRLLAVYLVGSSLAIGHEYFWLCLIISPEAQTVDVARGVSAQVFIKSVHVRTLKANRGMYSPILAGLGGMNVKRRRRGDGYHRYSEEQAVSLRSLHLGSWTLDLA